MSKLTEEQLSKLQELVGSINNLQTQIGGLEVQKHQALHQVGALQEQLSEFQAELQEEYGDVSINIQDGEITKQDDKD